MPPTPRPQIVVYPTPDEYKTLQQKAKEQGLSLSKYLIYVGLRAEINVQIEPKEIEEAIRQTKAFDAYMKKVSEMKQMLAKLQKEP